jgi:protein-tyrosine phosphatase
VPSTLLKRPAYALAKLAEMIPVSADRERFASWRMAEHIVVYDIDTAILSTGNNVAGLLKKFLAEGFTGQLGFLVGGFSGLAKSAQGASLIDTTPLEQSATSEEEERDSLGLLHSRQLPSSAFQQCE